MPYFAPVTVRNSEAARYLAYRPSLNAECCTCFCIKSSTASRVPLLKVSSARMYSPVSNCIHPWVHGCSAARNSFGVNAICRCTMNTAAQVANSSPTRDDLVSAVCVYQRNDQTCTHLSVATTGGIPPAIICGRGPFGGKGHYSHDIAHRAQAGALSLVLSSGAHKTP
eukprot:COSAG01_NODE_5739_length_4065_cov_2.031266_3_plen_168_part_00